MRVAILIALVLATSAPAGAQVAGTDVDAAPIPDPDPDPDPDPAPPLAPGVFYAGLALTFVSLAVGGYFGVEALAAHDRERTRDPRLPPDLAGIEESAITADVFFTLGALLAGATAIAVFFTDWTGDDAPPEAPSARVIPLPGGVAVVGRF